MLSLIRSSRPSALVVMIAMIAALWAQAFFSALDVAQSMDSATPIMPLYAIVLQLFGSEHSIWAVVLSFAIVVGMGIYLLNINARYIIIKHRGSAIALMFMLIASAIAPLHRLNPAVLAAVPVMRAFDLMMGLYTSPRPLDNVFRSGLMIGLAALFYAPVAVLALLLMACMLSMRPFMMREWIAAIVGLVLPFGIHFLVLFIIDSPIVLAWEQICSCFVTPLRSPMLSLPMLIVMSIGLGLPAIVALLFTLRRGSTLKMNVKKILIANLWMLAIVVLCFVLLPCAWLELIFIIGIPLSLLLANFFVHVRSKFWGNLMFVLLFVGAIATQIVPIIERL